MVAPDSLSTDTHVITAHRRHCATVKRVGLLQKSRFYNT